jgi:hypothetical protein
VTSAGVGAHDGGSVFAEYVVLLTLVSVGCVLAIASIGPPLLQMYLLQRAVLLLPQQL